MTPLHGAKTTQSVKIPSGKFRGLMAVSDKRGVIRAAAMDQRGSLKKSIAKAKGVDPKEITSSMMAEFKTAVSRVLTPYASAILLDPEYGLEAVKARAKGAGCLLAYESTGYDQTQPGRIPELIPDWTVKKSLENGADCIKVLLYYSPFEKSGINAIKHAFVSRIGAECAHYDVPFFLEFVGYDVAGGDDRRAGAECPHCEPHLLVGVRRFRSRPRRHADQNLRELRTGTGRQQQESVRI